MKALLFISVLAMTTTAFAADWKVIAESVDCSEKVQIHAKEGEKYVLAAHEGTKRKLYAEDGSAFVSKSMTSNIFKSDTSKEKYLAGEPTFAFTQPSEVEANPPKVDVFYNGKKQRCRMNLK